MAVLGSSPVVLAQITGAAPGRFVDVVEVEDHDDQADIVVQFTCSLRYITHQPASEGKELRIQLQPLGDCQRVSGAQILGELPPVSGGAHIIDAARVESDVPGQLTLVFDFRRRASTTCWHKASIRAGCACGSSIAHAGVARSW